MMNYEKARTNLKNKFVQHEDGKKVYKLAFFVSMLLNIVLVVGITKIGLQHKTVPYIVQVDKHGYSIAISRAEEARGPSDRVLISWIGQYITNHRTVVADSRAQKTLLDWVYASTPQSTPAYSYINSWYRTHNPYELARNKRTVVVQIESIMPMGDSKKTWQAKWEETAYSSGIKQETTRHTGIFTLDVAQNTDLKSVIANPLGIYITELQTTQNYY